jgi:hypothetical protein
LSKDGFFFFAFHSKWVEHAPIEWFSCNQMKAKSQSGSLCEKIHLKFCKFILGVHKRTTNIAVLSVLGRFPLYFNIIKCMLLYWYRLENLGKEFPLLKEAYNETKLLYLSKKTNMV